MYTLAQLEIFVHVAETGSFNKAAEEVFITPSAVMKHINNLEKEVNASLFERTHKGQQLTKAGEELYQSALRILQMCENSMVKVRAAAAPEQSPVRLGTAFMYPSEFFTYIWEEIQENHPEIKINLVPFDSSPTSDGYTTPQLGANIDVIISAYDEATIIGKNINGLEVMKVPLCAIMSASHRLASKDVLSLRDFEGETVLVTRKSVSKDIKEFADSLIKNNVNANLEEIFAFDVDIFNRCANSEAMLIGMRTGINVHPMLKRIPIDCNQESSFGFIYAKEPTPSTAHFIEVVKEILQKHND